MSLIVPFARQKLIKPGTNDPKITARLGILHVDAGNSVDLHDWFDGPSGGIESHLHIPKVGDPIQYRDVEYEADANFKANPFAMSVETQGYAWGEWNGQQIYNIKRVMIWGKMHVKIPLVVPKVWNGSGWGYHIQFEEWRPEAKACPGKERIEQYWDILVPWMKEADMAIEDTILNRADRSLHSNNRIEEMLKELLTKEQFQDAMARHERWAQTHPVAKS